MSEKAFTIVGTPVKASTEKVTNFGAPSELYGAFVAPGKEETILAIAKKYPGIGILLVHGLEENPDQITCRIQHPDTSNNPNKPSVREVAECLVELNSAEVFLPRYPVSEKEVGLFEARGYKALLSVVRIRKVDPATNQKYRFGWDIAFVVDKSGNAKLVEEKAGNLFDRQNHYADTTANAITDAGKAVSSLASM